MAKEGAEEGVEASQQEVRDYVEQPPAPLFDPVIAEFIVTLLFLYVTIATVIGYKKQTEPCQTVGLLGMAWSFGGIISVLVYCTAGISAVTFGLLLARKLSLGRAIAYTVAQCLGAICGVGIVKGTMEEFYEAQGGGANTVVDTYSKGTALGAEIIGTFVLVYTVFSATDPKRNARDSHVPWIFWVGPYVGALAAAIYHEHILKATAMKALGSFANPTD